MNRLAVSNVLIVFGFCVLVLGIGVYAIPLSIFNNDLLLDVRRDITNLPDSALIIGTPPADLTPAEQETWKQQQYTKVRSRLLYFIDEAIRQNLEGDRFMTIARLQALKSKLREYVVTAHRDPIIAKIDNILNPPSPPPQEPPAEEIPPDETTPPDQDLPPPDSSPPQKPLPQPSIYGIIFGVALVLAGVVIRSRVA